MLYRNYNIFSKKIKKFNLKNCNKSDQYSLTKFEKRGNIVLNTRYISFVNQQSRSDSMKKIEKVAARAQTLGEEIANAISHGLGTGLSIAGMIILIVAAVVHNKGAIAVVSAALYGAGLILLYTNSSLYHSLTNKRAKRVFKILDHCSIFVLIFSSYIPVLLVIIGGALGWTWFGICAACTVLGVVLNSINLERWKVISMVLYIVVGWSALAIMKPLLQAINTRELIFLVSGGVAYTLGLIFYGNKKIKYMHFIWHIFVLAGSVLQYFFFLSYYIR